MKPKVKLFKRGEQCFLIVTPKVSQKDFQKIVTEYFTDRILKFNGKEIAVTGGKIGPFFEAIKRDEVRLMDTDYYTGFTISNEAKWGCYEEPEELEVYCHHDISSFFRAYLHGTFQYHFFRSCIDEIASLFKGNKDQIIAFNDDTDQFNVLLRFIDVLQEYKDFVDESITIKGWFKDILFDEFLCLSRIRRGGLNISNMKNEFVKYFKENRIDYCEKNDVEWVEWLAANSKIKNSTITFPTPLSTNDLKNVANLDKELERIVAMKEMRESISKENSSIKLPEGNINMLFLGNPGTGKTTGVKAITKYLCQKGILKEPLFLERKPKDFVWGKDGASGTKQALDYTKGGVLFIDEAYALLQSQNEGWANEVINELLTHMSKSSSPLIIWAGYEDKIKETLKLNDGLASRFPYSFYFEDFSVEELFANFVVKIKSYGFTLDKDRNFKYSQHESCQKYLRKLFGYFAGRKNFGNGRFVENLINLTLRRHALNIKNCATHSKNDENIKIRVIFKNSYGEELCTRSEAVSKNYIKYNSILGRYLICTENIPSVDNNSKYSSYDDSTENILREINKESALRQKGNNVDFSEENQIIYNDELQGFEDYINETQLLEADAINASSSKVSYSFKYYELNKIITLDDLPTIEEIINMLPDKENYSLLGTGAMKRFDKYYVSNSEESDYNYLAELYELTGQNELKEIIKEIVKLDAYGKTVKQLKKEGCKLMPVNLHMIFSGNPGTGKTTIARIIARVLYEVGLLKYDYLVEAPFEKFREYHYAADKNIDDIFEEAKGGVIFIDEAYSFNCDEGRQFITPIIRAMEDYKDELVFIFAGYKSEMEEFVGLNAGIASRIGYSFYFPDYSTDSLMAIFDRELKKASMTVEDDAKTKVRDLVNYFRHADNFGNARFMVNLVNTIIKNHAINYSNIYNDLLNDDEAMDVHTVTLKNAYNGDKHKIILADIPSYEDIIKIMPNSSHMPNPDSESLAGTECAIYHELGHAMISRILCGNFMEINSICLSPTAGGAGAYVDIRKIPNKMPVTNKEYYENQICVLMGGIAAEKVALGSFSTGGGSSNHQGSDLHRAFAYAQIIIDSGLSSLGFVDREEKVFDMAYGNRRVLYNAENADIKREMKTILDKQFERAESLLTEHKECLEAFEKTLIKRYKEDKNYEPLNEDEVNDLFGIYGL